VNRPMSDYELLRLGQLYDEIKEVATWFGFTFEEMLELIAETRKSK